MVSIVHLTCMKQAGISVELLSGCSAGKQKWAQASGSGNQAATEAANK